MSDWAGVLGVWTWTFYSAEADTQMGRRTHHNMHFEAQLGRGTPERLPKSEYTFRRQLKTSLFKKSFPDVII